MSKTSLMNGLVDLCKEHNITINGTIYGALQLSCNFNATNKGIHTQNCTQQTVVKIEPKSKN